MVRFNRDVVLFAVNCCLFLKFVGIEAVSENFSIIVQTYYVIFPRNKTVIPFIMCSLLS